MDELAYASGRPDDLESVAVYDGYGGNYLTPGLRPGLYAVARYASYYTARESLALKDLPRTLGLQ